MVEHRQPDPAEWRPQAFGRRSFRDVRDPVIEPLWMGLRVLAHVTGGGARLLDGDGDAPSYPIVEQQLAEAVQAESVVLDGYLTDQVPPSSEGVVVVSGVEAPTAGQMARQMVAGGGRNRRQELDAVRDAEAEHYPIDEARVVFVAIDILWLDGESLLDVPLLERKRLLDSVIREDARIRLGVHVRLPVDPWIPTWRSIGFRGLAYKGANSRYRPGEANDAWATAPLPVR